MSGVSSENAVSGSEMVWRERVAWAYLAHVARGQGALVHLAVSLSGVEAAAEAVRHREVSEDLLRATARSWEYSGAEADLETAATLGARLVTPADAEWPQRLRMAGWLEGSTPVALWVRGQGVLPGADSAAVAFTGTRVSTAYGDHVASEFAGDLAMRGVSVLSGSGFGIEGAVLRAALGVGGGPVAVMPCGLDRAYPSGHARLLERVAEQGVVLSEYSFGAEPRRERFNGSGVLLAALSDAVVVPEAGARGRALSVAREAHRLGRAVYAIPGPVTSAASAGCHALIYEGIGRIAQSPANIEVTQIKS
ncbi:DNA-processing protein DprA [Rhodococcus sp. 06-235-1A]|uniref:DNA-processing protein DprA n=1 Tax=Rhodococcus sp. 06-235-1A TaxID=2022508 RepID=UPI00117B16C7|nr:DNA-processing protein DprA [Rhodococcus sp. 06-235-1A]